MEKKIRWGLMGAGKIVDDWIAGAKQFADMEVAAVSSRTIEHAKKTAEKYDIPEALTYEELVAREDIDVVYVPTINTAHKPIAMMAMEHGKSVLVEKPVAVNEAELHEMLACAKKNNVFFMEAVWTRFFPMLDQLRELIASDAIGQVRAMNMAFSFRVSDDQVTGRWCNPEMAGGGLLDVGIYDLNFTDALLNKEPVAMTGFASIDTDEFHIQTDEQATFICKYDKGELVTMSCAVRTDMSDVAMIYGTKGHLEVPHFWNPTSVRVVVGEDVKVIEQPVPQNAPGYEDKGYQFEIAHVNECLRKGLKESPIMSWNKSIQIVRECDELRRQWGLVYPFEK